MSKYTVEIKRLVEWYSCFACDKPMSKRIELSLSKIFDFDYPLWREDYKPILEKKIIMHYFNKEIAFETVTLWKFYLEEKLNLIMPYYNNLYATTVKDYDYLTNVNLKRVFNGSKNDEEKATLNITGETSDNGNETFTGNGESTLTGNKNQSTKSLKSDLPQANYNNLDYGTELTEGEQTGTENESTNTSNKSTTDRNNKTNINQDSINNLTKKQDENNIETETGSNGNKSLTELLLEYRNSLINIDNLIIEELKDLFMLIY